MKKRLLITSALMTAVLGASLATGTYAWYQVTGAAGHTETGSNVNITTASSSYTNGSIEFKATIANKDTSVKPVLTTNDGKTYYFVGDTTTKVEDTTADLVRYGTLTIKLEAILTGATGAATLGDILPTLAGNTVKVTISSDSTDYPIRLFKDTAPIGTSFTGASSVEFTYEIPSSYTSTETTATLINTTDLYYAITGLDDKVQNGDSEVNIKAVVTLVANS